MKRGELYRTFFEGWENAEIGTYIPSELTLINGDMGYWYVGDTVSTFSDECGPTPHKAEIIMK